MTAFNYVDRRTTLLMDIDESIHQVCEKCGGSNIQVRAWVNPNNLQYVDDSGDYDIDDNWCDDCEEHVGFITLEEYKQSKL